MDVLNEVVGLSLSSAERERSAGDFNVDLVAEDATLRTFQPLPYELAQQMEPKLARQLRADGLGVWQN